MSFSAKCLLPLCIAIAACGGGAAEAPKSRPGDIDSVAAYTLPSDQTIVAKLYDPDYSVPDGFFVDERAGLSQSYTVHHVMDPSASFELCTDEFSVAESWEAADNASRSVSGYYVGAHENDRYFEFIRELSYDDDIGNVDDLTSPGFARVFKCSNTQRDGVDRSLLSGYAGRLNVRPLTSPALREFTEYFWQFAFFPQRYRKVLDSVAVPGTLEHRLVLAFATTQGDGQCDLVEVAEWRFAADASGDIASSFSVLRRFEADLVDGSPQLCL